MDILEQAIADAKSIREAAVANAKATLEETFRPTLQRMISSRLEEEGEEDDIEMAADVAPEAPPAAPVAPEVPAEEAPVEDVPQAPAEEAPSQDDLDLEELLAELDALDQGSPEEEMMEGEDNDEDDVMEETIRSKGFGPDKDGGAYEGEAGLKHKNLKETDDADADDVSGEEDVNLDELFSETYKKKAPTTASVITENSKLKAKLTEALKAISILRKAVNETALLNAKLLYATKINRNFQLTENQKTKMLESFDRAANPRECTLIYTALAQSLTANKAKVPAARKAVVESVTRKGLGAPPVNEFSQRERWKQLSGITPMKD